MNKKGFLLVILLVILFNSMCLAQKMPVKLGEPEIKPIEEVKVVNAILEPDKTVRISAKTGGIIERLEIELGQIVQKDELLLAFDSDEINAQIKQAEAALEIARANYQLLLKGADEEQLRASKASVDQAEAALEMARASYEMILNGATAEDLAQVRAQYEQALVSNNGAKNSLDLLESIYQDRTAQKQQLISSKMQYSSSQKQIEGAEERLRQSEAGLEQAQNALEQAQKEYDRVNYLYQEKVATSKQFELVETQLKNARIGVETARSAVENAKIAKKQAEISYEGAGENYLLAKDSYDNPSQLKQQLEGAKTQLQVAEANLKIAKANLEKVKKGAREEDIRRSLAGLQQAEAALEMVRANYTKLEKGAGEEEKAISLGNVKQAEAALEMVRLRAEDTKVFSPLAGSVAQVYYEEGEMAGPGTPICTIVDIDHLYAKAGVSADIIKKIDLDDIVKVKVLSYPDKLLEGKIEVISPVIDPQSRSFNIKVLIENEEQRLKAGMFADLYLVVNSSPNALVIPTSAVLSLDDSPYVFLFKEGRVERREIKVGLVCDDELEVLAGVEKDDQLVVKGQSSLQSGELVEVIE